MLDTSQNIFRRIIRETCTIYKNKVKRELVRQNTGGESGEPVENPRYVGLCKQVNLDWKLAEAHRLSKAAWVCFLRPRVLESTGEMRLDIITPDMAHVDLNRDDPLKMDGFGYFVQGKDKNGQTGSWWVYYTPDQRRYLDASGREVENPFSDDLDTTNKYGVIPVVPFFCVAPATGFWDLNWNRDAVRANFIIGVLNTYMNYLVKTQSFKQMVFTGKIGPDILNGISDPLFPISLPEKATAATLDLNTQLNAIDQVIRGKVSAIANNYGISNENFTLTGDVASGFSLRVANRALEEIREADKTVVQQTEKQLFALMRIMNNAESGEPIDEMLELKWNPGEIAYPPSMDEEQSRWDFEFKNGIKNAVDYLIDDDPDLSREEAMKLLERVKEENDKIKPKPSILETMFGGAQEEETPFGKQKEEKPNPFQKKGA